MHGAAAKQLHPIKTLLQVLLRERIDFNFEPNYNIMVRGAARASGVACITSNPLQAENR